MQFSPRHSAPERCSYTAIELILLTILLLQFNSIEFLYTNQEMK